MKIMLLTHQYGGRCCTNIGYGGGSVFFAGISPPINTFITIEIPKLQEWHYQSAYNALVEQLGGTGSASAQRRQLVEIPEGMWSLTVLDDLLNAGNLDMYLWQLPRHFSLEAITEFAGKWYEKAQGQLSDATAISDPQKRLAKLNDINDFVSRYYKIVGQFPNAIVQEKTILQDKLERAQVRALIKATFSPELWIKTAANFHQHTPRQTLMRQLSTILGESTLPEERLHEILTQIAQHETLRFAALNDAHFWKPLADRVRFGTNITGETIDISKATATKIVLSWQIVTAKRVGRIIPGRQALTIVKSATDLIYIGADRQLKFQVMAAGGKLERFGNTLVMGDDGSNQLRQALLEVEMLDTLANVNPAEAITRMAHLNLPPTHAMFDTAKKAETDPRYGRVLADLLIELSIGVDADVARNLVRQQTGFKR
jgi:hypothetical protein